MRTIFLATLLAGTAIATAGYAQDAKPVTPKENRATQDKGNTADIVVQPNAPEIKVDVPDPSVSVKQAQPIVSVTQPKPTIIVRQPAPKVTVDIPQPEIIVQMPKPQVNVEQAQPEVSVNQGKPQVSVSDSGQPAVQANESTDQAKVNVQQAQPKVSVMGTDQQPEVRYESEKAQVQVNQPDGKPKIRYENEDGSAASNEQTGDPANVKANPQPQPAADAKAMQKQSNASEAREGVDMAVNAGATKDAKMTVRQITDYDIVGADGKTLGDIENVVNNNNKLYAVIGSGGFLGLGEKSVAIPLSSLMFNGDHFVSPSITDSQVNSLKEFKVDQYPELKANQTVTVGQN